MEQKELYKKAEAVFSNYLEANKLRKTTERFAILKEIYDRDDHFDAESLFEGMKAQNYNVSRATVYNNLDLLLECNLITRHQFGKNQSQYEKAYGSRQHDHIICEECQAVTEFCDPRIQNIIDMMEKISEYKISGHSLHLYGKCPSCLEKENTTT